MQLVVNGETRDFDPAPATVAALIDALALPRSRVAVELNGTIVPKREHEDRGLSGGDVLEIVTLVGGG